MTEENLMLIHTATIRYRHKNEYYDRYTVLTQKQKVNGFVWISTNDDSRKVVNCEKMLNYLESLYIEKKND